MDFTDETIPIPRIGDQGSGIRCSHYSRKKFIFLWTLTANGLFFSVILPISLRYVPPNSSLSEL